jgi:hypothetical protein
MAPSALNILPIAPSLLKAKVPVPVVFSPAAVCFVTHFVTHIVHQEGAKAGKQTV